MFHRSTRFSRLLKEIFDRQIERTVEDLLPKIKATLSIAKYQRFPALSVPCASPLSIVWRRLSVREEGLSIYFKVRIATMAEELGGNGPPLAHALGHRRHEFGGPERHMESEFYLRARREWDERYGDLVLGKRN